MRRLRSVSRLDLLSWCVLAIMLLLGSRLFYLQVVRYPHYRALQSRQVVNPQTVPARRGRILDRNGKVLAFDTVGYDIAVVKKRFRPTDLPLLAAALDRDVESLRARLARNGRFVTLAEGVGMSAGAARKLGALPGVCLEKKSYRNYPYGTLAAQAIGFTDGSGHGKEGIEKAFDAALRGRPGEVVLLEDEDGDPLAVRSRREPIDGQDVVLTLDVELQSIADAELRRSVRKYGAKGGAVLLMDPHTGEMLACASAPAPAARDGNYEPGTWRNRAVTDLFEPGSTLKPLTAIAALRRDIVDLDTRIHAERGAMRFGAAGVVHDAHEPGDGWLTFPQAFAKSSNICFAKIARAIPSSELYDELRAFGFASLTGVLLPGEVGGSLEVPRHWSGRTRLSLGYGHEIGVTAVQLAGLYTTIANGGRLIQPRIASRIVDRQGRVQRTFESQELRRPLDADLAATLRDLCRLVVDEGTGESAQVDGVFAAGKTGTAQKAVDGRYVSRFVASFGGFVPADDPKLVCLVVIDEPRGVYHWGGMSAAPTFRRIVEAALRGTDYLEPRPERIQFVRADDLDARDAALATPHRFTSLGRPALPDFRGEKLQVAASWLRRFGIRSRAVGDGIVVETWPRPGAALARDAVVRLRCEPERSRPRHAGVWPQ